MCKKNARSICIENSDYPDMSALIQRVEGSHVNYIEICFIAWHLRNKTKSMICSQHNVFDVEFKSNSRSKLSYKHLIILMRGS